MNETLTLIDETVPEVDLQWQQRLDELVRGECSEDAFMDHVLNLREAGPYTAWNVVALLDQCYRRGQLPAEVFRSIESKIAQYELADIDYGMTIDLLPAAPSAQAPNPESRPAAPAALASLPKPRVPSPTEPAPATISPGPAAAPAPTAAPALTAAPARTAAPALTAAPVAPIPVLGATAAVPRSSSERPTSAVPEIGYTLRQRYVIERRLGKGGMGTVFKALDHYRCDLPEGDRHVAIKFLHQRINGRPDILSDLRREFYCAQALAHPSIVKVYELDQDEDFVFFTMEFLEGELLSGVMERLNPRKISRSSAWTLIQGIAAGLSHAHSRNVVHADLKPHNIMITSQGEIRILDFGAASSTEPDRAGADANQKSNSTVLTPAYASCELLERKPADPRDDLYALACVAYELLAGEHPFQRRRSTEARDLGLVARRPESLTRSQWNALAQGLSFRREARSISVADWLAQLNPPANTPARLSVPLGLTPAAEPPAAAPVPVPMPATPPTQMTGPTAVASPTAVAGRDPAPQAPVGPPTPTPAAVRAPIAAPTLVAARAPIAVATPASTQVAAATRAWIAAPTPVVKPAPTPAAARAAQVETQSPTPPLNAASISKSLRSPRSMLTGNFTSTALRVAAALAVVVLAVGLWLSLNRRSIDAAPVLTATTMEPSAQAAVSPQSPASGLAPSAMLGAQAQAQPDGEAQAEASAQTQSPAAQLPAAAQIAKPEAAQPAPHRARINGISLSGATYRVRPRQNFAELRVHRTPGAPGSASFVWWTEPGSAAAGLDFVPQARVTQLLPAGTSAASLFVRLLHNTTRRHSAVFYVVIGEPGNGATLGRIARTAVVVPAS
jgi:serine/threonine protein kinase